MAKTNTFSLPDEKGNFIQLNDNSGRGNIYASRGVDLSDGKIEVSRGTKYVLREEDDADFDGTADAIVAYDSLHLHAFSDGDFYVDIDNPFGAWAQNIEGDYPTTNGGDAVVLNGELLRSTARDISMWSTTADTWVDDWWSTDLGQGQFAIGSGTHLMIVGTDGNLYVTDTNNKLYKHDPLTSTTSKTGGGTLDFSTSTLEFVCLAKNSNRLWIGCKDTAKEFGAILEWDMSPSSTTVNKIHYVPGDVLAIAIHNDTPYAVVDDGKIRYFNGVGFEEYKGFQFPLEKEQILDEDFINRNGWAIIDDMVHFLVSGRLTNSFDVDIVETNARISAGVWCLDPGIGLYNRFPLTADGYGLFTVNKVGALFALKNSASKFIASFDYKKSNETLKGRLVYHDANNAGAVTNIGYIMTPAVLTLREAFKSVETWYKPQTGTSINVYSRTELTDPTASAGYWLNTTTFNATQIGLGAVAGDVVFIKNGDGAGQWLRVESVNETASLTSITFTATVSDVAVNEYGVIDIYNFRYMGTINSPTLDYQSLSIPSLTKTRKRQFLFEFIQPVNTTIEIDYIVVS